MPNAPDSVNCCGPGAYRPTVAESSLIAWPSWTAVTRPNVPDTKKPGHFGPGTLDDTTRCT